MSDKDEISKVIQTYIDGMNFSSAEKTKEAFHPNASVVGYLHGDFLEMQATVNELVLEVNNRMTEINSLMIETNKI